MFTEGQIKRFQKICEEETEESLSKADAIRQGSKLVNLVKIIRKKN
jgi:hypothetical protein